MQFIFDIGLKAYEGIYKDDKDIIPVPRQVSCTIMQTFAKWGKSGHNTSESSGITTVKTTKQLCWNAGSITTAVL